MGHFQPGQVAQWLDSLTGCLRCDCSLLLQRQDSGPRNTWLDSWACSLQAVGLRGCWHLENGAGGPERGACKSGGILVGGLCLYLCPSSPSFPPTSFFPFHLSLPLLSPRPSPQQKVLAYPSVVQSLIPAFTSKVMLGAGIKEKFPTFEVSGLRGRVSGAGSRD